MSMDSVDGVPVSAAKRIPLSMAVEVNPKASLLSSSSGSSSFLIRAPLTVDSDSDNEFESEDEFETVVNKKLVVVTPDDKIKETSGGKEFVVSKNITTGPDEIMSEESSNVGKVVSSVFPTGPDDFMSDESSNVGKVVVSKSFVGVNGKSLVIPQEEGGYSGVGVETKVMDDEILSPPKPSMPPIAKLSRDSDEDSVGSVFEEDNDFWGVARVPDIRTTENLTDSKVQVVGVAEGDKDNESQFKSVSQPEVLEDTVSSELVSGVLGRDEEVAVVEKDSSKDDILAGLVKDEGPDTKGNIKGTVLVESEVSFPTALVESEISLLSDSSILDKNVKYPDEETHGLENMEQATELHETISTNSGASLDAQGEIAVDSTGSKEVVKGGLIVDTRIDGLRSLIYLDSSPTKAGKIFSPKAEVKLGYIAAVGANTTKVVDVEVDYDIQSKEVHKPGGEIALESKVSFIPDSSVVDEKPTYKEVHVHEDMEQVTELYATNIINPGASLECDSTTLGETAVDSTGSEEVVEGATNIINPGASLECDSTTLGETAVDSTGSEEVVEGGPIVNTRNDELKSVIYFPIDSSPPEADNVFGFESEFESVDITELGVEVVNTLDEKLFSDIQGEGTHKTSGVVDTECDEKLFSDIQGEETHKTGGDVDMECDLTYSAYEENADADRNINIDALSVHNLNCEIIGAPVKSETFSPGSTSEKTESILEQGIDFLNGHLPSRSGSGLMEDDLHCKSNIHVPGLLGYESDHVEVENKSHRDSNLVSSREGSGSDDYLEGVTLVESNTVKNIASKMELKITCDSFFDGEIPSDNTRLIDELVTYSDEDVFTFEDSEGKASFDSTASTLSDVAKGAKTDGNSVKVTYAGDSGILFLEHLADLNKSIDSVGLTTQTDRPIISTSAERESQKIFGKEKQLNMQKMRVKYLRLVQRLGLSGESSIVENVLYRLDLVSGSSSNQEVAERAAVEVEANNKEDVDFSLNILVIGKCGVGKSSTINSIFGEEKAIIDSFEPATTVVKEIVGTIDDITLRVLDTPGLSASLKDQAVNEKILKSIRRHMKKCPPDVVLYVDRLDMHTRDLNDLALLRSITSFLGSSVWRKTIITLTHAASTPPDGPSGAPLSFEMFVALRSQVIQQLIGHTDGDHYMVDAALTCPVSVVENHSLCEKGTDGQALLPNGETWKPQLLLLCYSIKILSEVNSISKVHIRDDSLMQSCSQLKVSANQDGENMDSAILMGGSCGPTQEDEEDSNQLLPLEPLKTSDIADLSTEQSTTTVQEYDNRVKPLQTQHSWDYDMEYDGVSVEERIYGVSRYNSGIVAQIKKDGSKLSFYIEPSVAAMNISWGCNMQSRQNMNVALCAGLSSKQSGKLSVKFSSSEQLPMALVSLQIVGSIFRNFFSSHGADHKSL